MVSVVEEQNFLFNLINLNMRSAFRMVIPTLDSTILTTDFSLHQ